MGVFVCQKARAPFTFFQTQRLVISDRWIMGFDNMGLSQICPNNGHLVGNWHVACRIWFQNYIIIIFEFV